MKNRCRLKNHSFEHRDKSKKSIQFAVLLAVIILASKVLVGCAHVASTDPFSKGLDNAISVSGFTVKSPGAIQILLKNVSNEAWMLEIPDMIAFSLTWKEANPDSVMLLGQTRWGGASKVYCILWPSTDQRFSDMNSSVFVSGQYFDDQQIIQAVDELQIWIYGMPVSELPRAGNLKEWNAAFHASETLISGPLREGIGVGDRVTSKAPIKTGRK